MRKGSGTHGLPFTDIAAGYRACECADLLQNLKAPRIGQRLRDAIHLRCRKCLYAGHDFNGGANRPYLAVPFYVLFELLMIFPAYAYDEL